MQFKTKYISGNYYVITKFLWLPKKIGNAIKWLETATFGATYDSLSPDGHWKYDQWIDSNKNDIKNKLISSLCQLANECKEIDWDGVGASPITKQTLNRAKTFIYSLPDTVSLPEISAEYDGSISLDWIKEKDEMFSISINEDNRFCCAWIHKNEKDHFTVSCNTKRIPDVILTNIIKFSIQSNS